MLLKCPGARHFIPGEHGRIHYATLTTVLNLQLFLLLPVTGWVNTSERKSGKHYYRTVNVVVPTAELLYITARTKHHINKPAARAQLELQHLFTDWTSVDDTTTSSYSYFYFLFLPQLRSKRQEATATSSQLNPVFILLTPSERRFTVPIPFLQSRSLIICSYQELLRLVSCTAHNNDNNNKPFVVWVSH